MTQFKKRETALNFTGCQMSHSMILLIPYINSLSLSSIKKMSHYENMPIQIYWKSYHQKNEYFQIKILIFFIFLLKTKIVGTR